MMILTASRAWIASNRLMISAHIPISPSPVWLANGRQGESSAERLQGSQLS
jgi:hypothetical protein